MRPLSLSVLLIGMSLAAQSPTGEDLRLFAWLDGVGFPDPTGRKVVEVTTKMLFRGAVLPWVVDRRIGLVLAERKDEIRVLTSHLEECPVLRTRPDPDRRPDQQVDYRAVPLELVARRRLAALPARGDRKVPPTPGRGGVPSPPADAVVIAWFCHRNDLTRLAAELMAAARGAGAAEADFDAGFQDELGHCAFWRLVLSFQDPSVSYQELLTRHQRFVSRFKGHRHVDRARANLAVLERMVREAGSRSAKAQPLRGAARIAELIHQLRTQNGMQVMEPGGVSIWCDDRGDRSPAHQLLRMDFAAVPALIEALRDDTFTRQVACVRGFYFSHHVLRVGDCAWRILEAISGETFHQPGYFSETPSSAGASRLVKIAAENWWRRVQAVGEKTWLVEGVRKGDRSSPALATRLLKRFPADALAAIRAGYQGSADDWPKQMLLGQSTLAKGQAARDWFAELLRSSVFEEQFAGAVGLARNGDMHGVPVAAGLLPDAGDHRERVVTFLATCGDPGAWETLEELPLLHRETVLQILDPTWREPDLFRFGGDSLSLPQVPPTHASWRAAAERFCRRTISLALAGALSQETLLGGDGGIAVQASSALARRWPDRYSIGEELPVFAALRLARDRRAEGTAPAAWLELPPRGGMEIARVDILSGAKEISPSWRARLAALVGKELDIEAILALVRTNPPRGWRLQLLFSRPEPDRKVVVFARCGGSDDGDTAYVAARDGSSELGCLVSIGGDQDAEPDATRLKAEWPRLVASGRPWEIQVQLVGK